MVRLLKFTEIWSTERKSDLYVNEDSIDSIETFNVNTFQIHTKAGVKYKVDKEDTLKIIEGFIIKENDGVA